MRVFISWSGQRSREVALALREWLPCVIHQLKPWMSSEDIGVGRRWSLELANELKETQFGVLCITQENVASPWLNFESGALSKIVEDCHVGPYLLDFDSTQLPGPLGQFQATRADKEGTLQLLESLNSALAAGVALSKPVLEKTFEKWWPELNQQLRRVSSTIRGKLDGGDLVMESSSPAQPASNVSEAKGLRFARSAIDFAALGHGEFADYLRRFVRDSPANTTVKILNIDGVELFGGDVSGVTELYLPLLRTKGVSIKVLLVNPTSNAPLFKRQIESAFRLGDRLRYEPNHPDRIYRKILSSCGTLSDYAKRCPGQLECKFVAEMPSFSFVLSGGRGVAVLHSQCHKGWDSPVLLIGPNVSGLYGFWEEYFDFLWESSSCEVLKIENEAEEQIIAPFRERFKFLFPQKL